MVNRGEVVGQEVNRGEVEGQEVNIEGEGLAVNREELTSISNRKNQVHLLQQIYIGTCLMFSCYFLISIFTKRSSDHKLYLHALVM